MTKSLIITFDETDESFLMTLFKKLTIKTQVVFTPTPVFVPEPFVDNDPPPTKVEFLNDLREAVAEMHAHQRGEIELQSIESLMAELAEESASA